jgi:hypothetical protein
MGRLVVGNVNTQDTRHSLHPSSEILNPKIEIPNSNQRSHFEFSDFGFRISILTLPLFVSRVAANDVNTPPTPHQLAILADALDARPNLHGGRISRSPETQFRQTVNLAIETKGNKG